MSKADNAHSSCAIVIPGSLRATAEESFIANGIDPERIFSAKGENLPFEDGSFQIAYSANMLDHSLTH